MAGFRGFTAAASLKRAGSSESRAGEQSGFRGFTAAASLKPRRLDAPVDPVGAGFRGFTAAASLKLRLLAAPGEQERRFPRLHRRGLIEAGNRPQTVPAVEQVSAASPPRPH